MNTEKRKKNNSNNAKGKRSNEHLTQLVMTLSPRSKGQKFKFSPLHLVEILKKKKVKKATLLERQCDVKNRKEIASLVWK